MTSSAIPLVVRRVIPGTAAPLFDAFMTAGQLSRWFTPSPEIAVDVLQYEFVENGILRLRYSMADGRTPVVNGRFFAIRRPVEIAFSWEWEAPDPLANIPMQVSFEFCENDGATEVVVTHWGIPTDTACTIHQDGWTGTLATLEHQLLIAGNLP